MHLSASENAEQMPHEAQQDAVTAHFLRGRKLPRGCIRMSGLSPLGLLGKLERRLQDNVAPRAKVVGRDVNRDIRGDADAFEL